MAVVTGTVVVQRLPADVFAYVADILKHAEWSPKPYRAEKVTDGPIGVGTKYHSVGWLPRRPENENDVEVTAYDSPTRFAFDAFDRGERFHTDFQLTPEGSGTKVTRSLDLPKPPGFTGLIFPIILSRVIRPDVQKGLENMKARLEP